MIRSFPVNDISEKKKKKKQLRHLSSTSSWRAYQYLCTKLHHLSPFPPSPNHSPSRDPQNARMHSRELRELHAWWWRFRLTSQPSLPVIREIWLYDLLSKWSSTLFLLFHPLQERLKNHTTTNQRKNIWTNFPLLFSFFPELLWGILTYILVYSLFWCPLSWKANRLRAFPAMID